MRSYRVLPFTIIMLLLNIFFIPSSFAATENPNNITEQLLTISTDLQDLQIKREELNKEIKTETEEDHRLELEENLKRINAQIREYTELFEKISLGGIDIARFETPAKQVVQQTEDYNWQKELIQIAQPVFAEMKKITDAPRKRDLLRLEQKEIDARLDQLNKGIVTFDAIQKTDLPANAQKSLQSIQENWSSLHKELERERRLTELKLDELTTKEDFLTRLTKGTWGFIKGRGLLLLITIASASILLYGFNRLLVLLESREKNIISIRWRIFILLYQVITILIIATITLAILYSSGDMVLFGVAILIILAFLVSSRNSIPKYFMKMRIFLNMGQAREGERVLYNDLPWRINRINLYTVYLVNPLLENGTMRLTIDHLNNMISRPIKMDETWFPTIVNDVVILPNGNTYKVQRQTPEYVYLIASGTEVIYPSKDFMKDKITNITYGYSTSTEFSININSLQKGVDEAIEILHANLTQFIADKQPDAYKAMKSLTVDFSRLNDNGNAIFMISASMGSFATDYRSSLLRTIQKGCLQTAKENNWEITSITKYAIEQK